MMEEPTSESTVPRIGESRPVDFGEAELERLREEVDRRSIKNRGALDEWNAALYAMQVACGETLWSSLWCSLFNRAERKLAKERLMAAARAVDDAHVAYMYALAQLSVEQAAVEASTEDVEHLRANVVATREAMEAAYDAWDPKGEPATALVAHRVAVRALALAEAEIECCRRVREGR